MCLSRKNAPSVPAALRRSASARSTRFSLPENRRRRPIAKTSGSGRCAPEALSTLALRSPSGRASEEASVDPFKELFDDEVMCMSYLYSKLPETGVPHHIGTQGPLNFGVRCPEEKMSRFQLPGTCARTAVLVVTLVLVCACATPALAPGAEKVQLTQKADDVVHCTAVGNINPARDAKGGTTFSSPADFRNQAIGLSGNTVFITRQYMGSPIEGVVYRCPGRG